MRGTTLARPAVAEAAAQGAIDDALARAAHRGAYTAVEVDGIFRTVSGVVHDPVTSAAIRSIFDDAVPVAAPGELVERSRVVDVLLDARLLVAAAG